jgi:hypothetical protein
MISLETAKALKDAGLKWKPQEGDYCYYDDKLELQLGECLKATRKLHNLTAKQPEYKELAPIFAPSLSQLLQEIEKRGYLWDMSNLGGEFNVMLWDVRNGKEIEEDEKESYNDCETIVEEAAAQALLWILNQK